MAALVQIGTGAASGGAGQASLTFTAAPTAGNLLVAVFAIDTNSDTAILTPPPGWAEAVPFETFGDTDWDACIYYKVADGSGTKVFWWRSDWPGNAGVVGGEFSGLALGDLIDQQDTYVATGSVSTINLPALTAPTQNQILYIVGFATKHWQATALPDFTFDTGAVTLGEHVGLGGGTNLDVAFGYRIVTDGTTLDTSADWTGNAVAPWIGAVGLLADTSTGFVVKGTMVYTLNS